MAEINDRVRDCLTPKEVEDEPAEDAVHPDDVPISLDS